MRLEASDADYPKRLLQLSDPPRGISVRGRWPLPEAPIVAVVGARRASEEAKNWTHRLAFDLGRAGAVVVSGGALGIDAAAHRGALEAGACTVVVLPTPIESPAPASHRGLFEDILAQGGAWLSDTDQVSGRWAFVKRNRLVAALCDVLVIAEAEMASGTASTVAAAQTLERPVRVRPVGLGSRRGALNLELLCQGVPAARDVGDELKGAGVAFEGPQEVTAETLAEREGCSVALARARLVRWELQGRAKPLGGGRYACF